MVTEIESKEIHAFDNYYGIIRVAEHDGRYYMTLTDTSEGNYGSSLNEYTEISKNMYDELLEIEERYWGDEKKNSDE